MTGNLSELEIMALKNLISQEEQTLAPLLEIQKRLVAPIQDEQMRLARMVEKRLELPEGSIGKTHSIDMNTLSVEQAKPAETMQEFPLRPTSPDTTNGKERSNSMQKH